MDTFYLDLLIMINLKYISYLLIPILLVSSSYFAYYHLHSLNNNINHPTLPKVISEAKNELSEAKKQASVSVQKVLKRQQTKPLSEVVSVGTVLTLEKMTELQARETQDISAIQALQAVIAASDAVIAPQQALITELNHKVIIWKILSGIIIILAIIILI